MTLVREQCDRDFAQLNVRGFLSNSAASISENTSRISLSLREKEYLGKENTYGGKDA